MCAPCSLAICVTAIWCLLSFRIDSGGLEIRGDGAGSAVPLAVHDRLRGGDGGHHPVGPESLGHPSAHRHQILQTRSTTIPTSPPRGRLGLKVTLFF